MMVLDGRFWSKVNMLAPNGCWEWMGARHEFGYGVISAVRGERKAHRLALADQGVDISGMVVRHKCDNPPCVNPMHLEVGTQKDNAEDMVARGRSTKGERNGSSVLTEDVVAVIKARLRTGEQGTKLAAEFGVAKSTISRIRRGEHWAHVEPAT